jgi:hypothetical protein
VSKFKAIFIRNPKCATISIRSAINKQGSGTRFDELEKHQTALQWMGEIPNYKKHFVFSVCRNPYDRLLSGYMFICKRKLDKHEKILEKYGTDFESFVLNLEEDFGMKLADVDMVTWPQWIWVTDSKGNCIVDNIGRFEKLPEWWKSLCKQRGWKHSPLPKSNKTRHGPWREYYTPDMIKVVNEQYADDFNLFGYKTL